ncbi:MAG: prolyl-tRNA synthetase, partial [Chitinophagia bacterium]|nr:prolyl-tRNA synthetase [Chitinophagia bacterium]
MVPSEEESKNAQLLIRAGYVHKEMSGVYSYLPLGKIVLDNIANIVREEINKTGAFEVQMSSLQSRDLWEKTGRWDDKLVDNWFKTKLANGQELGLGLTHEEPVINSLLPFVSSYKDLPFAVYQVQNKFRNEIRAKSGLMRSRELLMKDQYSFSKSEDDHKKYYEEMADVYLKIYSRFGVGDITYRTYADGGIFSEFSDEFQTLSEVGEDTIYVDEEKGIAINK